MSNADDHIDAPLDWPFGAFSRLWWLLLLRGVAAILFGVAIFAWPEIGLLTLVVFYGVYAIFDSGVAFAAALRGGASSPRWWFVLVGLISLAAGVTALLLPGVTAVVLVILIGVWAIFRGLMEILAAVSLRKVIRSEWLLAAAGAMSILFGLVLVIEPGVGALAVLGLIGGFAILTGGLMVALGLKLRNLQRGL